MVFRRLNRDKVPEHHGTILNCIPASESETNLTDSLTESLGGTNKRLTQCFTNKRPLKKKCINPKVDDTEEHHSLLNLSIVEANKEDTSIRTTEVPASTLDKNVLEDCHASVTQAASTHHPNKSSFSSEFVRASGVPNLTDQERILAFRKCDSKTVLKSKAPRKVDTKDHLESCGDFKRSISEDTCTELRSTDTRMSNKHCTSFEKSDGRPSINVDEIGTNNRTLISDSNKNYRQKDFQPKSNILPDSRGKYTIEPSHSPYKKSHRNDFCSRTEKKEREMHRDLHEKKRSHDCSVNSSSNNSSKNHKYERSDRHNTLANSCSFRDRGTETFSKEQYFNTHRTNANVPILTKRGESFHSAKVFSDHDERGSINCSRIFNSLPGTNVKVDNTHRGEIEEGEICSDEDYGRASRTKNSTSYSEQRNCDLKVRNCKRMTENSRSRMDRQMRSKERDTLSSHDDRSNSRHSHRSIH